MNTTQPLQGLKESLQLHSIAWGLNRSKTPWVIAPLITVFVALALTTAAHTGTIVKIFAAQGNETDSSIVGAFAKNYLGMFQTGELGTIGAIAFTLCLISAILAPIPGTMTTAAINPRHTVTLSPNRWHRYWDSIIGQLSSPIPLLQLIILTALSSALTIDQNSTPAIIVAFTLWVTLNSLSVAVLWVMEWVHRKNTSRNLRLWVLTPTLLLTGALFLIKPTETLNVFGLGDAYINLIQKVTANPLTLIPTIIIALTVTIVLTAAAGWASNRALQYPPKEKAPRNTTTPLSVRLPGTSVWAITLNTLLRTPALLRPILFAVAAIPVTTLLLPATDYLTVTFAFSLPLIIALSWGANALAPLSSGITLLSIQPGTLKNMVWVVFTTQVTLATVLSIIGWLPALAVGRITPDQYLAAQTLTLIAAVITARAATTRSFKKATPLHYGSRGEAALSTPTSMQYLLTIALLTGFPVMVLDSLEVDLTTTLAALAVITVWQILRLSHLHIMWSNPINRSRIITAINADD